MSTLLSLEKIETIRSDARARRVTSSLSLSRDCEFWPRLGSAAIHELAVALGINLLLCVGAEDGDPEYPELPTLVELPLCFDTHCYGTDVWGWRSGRSRLEHIVTADELRIDGADVVADCEATLLMLGNFDQVASHLRALACAPDRFALELDALAPAVTAAFGTSCHSGDFIWLPA